MSTAAALPKAYLFSGDDTVGKDTARSRALQSIHKAHSGAIIEFYDPSEAAFAEYLDRIMMPTLFSDIRIFIVTSAESLGERELAHLDALIAAPPDDVYVIVDIGDTGKKKSAKNDPLKKLRFTERSKDTSGSVVARSFQKPPEYKVVQWLIDSTPDLCGRTISQEVATLLVDLAGHDTATLYSELQKLDVHLDDGEEVNAESVRQIVGASRQMTVFELAAACTRKDALRVLEILDSLFTTVFSIPMLLSVLYRNYSSLLRIRSYGRLQPGDIKALTRSGGNFNAKNEAAFRIGCAAGLLRPGEERKVYPVIIAPGIVAQAQQYTDEELILIIKWLLEFDVAVKTGRRRASRIEVELFCYRLMRVSALNESGVAA